MQAEHKTKAPQPIARSTNALNTVGKLGSSEKKQPVLIGIGPWRKDMTSGRFKVPTPSFELFKVPASSATTDKNGPTQNRVGSRLMPANTFARESRYTTQPLFGDLRSRSELF